MICSFSVVRDSFLYTLNLLIIFITITGRNESLAFSTLVKRIKM